MRVLIVEDNTANQFLVKELCRAAGVDSAIANNGEEAVRAAKDNIYDLILMDIHMPVMDGVAATTHIRQLPPPHGNMLIFALTADSTAETRETCNVAGMNEVLSKPLRPAQLSAILKTIRDGFAGKDASTKEASKEVLGKPSFEERLTRLLGNVHDVTGARVHVLGLSKIKQHFEATWERIASRIDGIVKSTIEAHLVTGDIYCKTQDIDYMMAFARLNESEGCLKCAEIAAEISRRLMGEVGSELVEIRTVVVTLNKDDIVQLDTDHAALSKLIPVPHDGPSSEIADSGPLAPGPRIDIMDGFDVTYRPVFNPERDSFPFHRCQPRFTDPRVEAAFHDEVDGKEDTLAKFDRSMQQIAIPMIGKLQKELSGALVLLPVHYQTLASHVRRHDYMKGFEGYTKDITKKMIVEIKGIPHGILQLRLGEITAPFIKRGFVVAACVDVRFQDFGVLNANKLKFVGMDFTDFELTNESYSRKIQQVSRLTAGFSFILYATGITSPLFTPEARKVFRYFDGEGIAAARQIGHS